MNADYKPLIFFYTRFGIYLSKLKNTVCNGLADEKAPMLKIAVA